MRCPNCDNEYSEDWRVNPNDDALIDSKQRVQCDCCGQWLRRCDLLRDDDFGNEKILSIREIAINDD